MDSAGHFLSVCASGTIQLEAILLRDHRSRNFLRFYLARQRAFVSSQPVKDPSQTHLTNGFFGGWPWGLGWASNDFSLCVFWLCLLQSRRPLKLVLSGKTTTTSRRLARNVYYAVFASQIFKIHHAIRKVLNLATWTGHPIWRIYQPAGTVWLLFRFGLVSVSAFE